MFKYLDVIMAGDAEIPVWFILKCTMVCQRYGIHSIDQLNISLANTSSTHQEPNKHIVAQCSIDNVSFHVYFDDLFFILLSAKCQLCGNYWGKWFVLVKCVRLTCKDNFQSEISQMAKFTGPTWGPIWVLSAPVGPHEPCYQGYCPPYH